MVLVFMNVLLYVTLVCFFWQQYHENRLKYLEAEKAEGKNPYPHKFAVSLSISEYIDKYGGIGNGEHLEDVSVSLAGNGIFYFRWHFLVCLLCSMC